MRSSVSQVGAPLHLVSPHSPLCRMPSTPKCELVQRAASLGRRCRGRTRMHAEPVSLASWVCCASALLCVRACMGTYTQRDQRRTVEQPVRKLLVRLESGRRRRRSRRRRSQAAAGALRSRVCAVRVAGVVAGAPAVWRAVWVSCKLAARGRLQPRRGARPARARAAAEPRGGWRGGGGAGCGGGGRAGRQRGAAVLPPRLRALLGPPQRHAGAPPGRPPPAPREAPCRASPSGTTHGAPRQAAGAALARAAGLPFQATTAPPSRC